MNAQPLPEGDITLLFTDIEGSTRLLHQLGGDYPALLERHCAILRGVFNAHGGREISTQGDSFFVVFQHASDAVQAAARSQEALHSEPWPRGVRVLVRMGLHTGCPQRSGDDYVGLDLHRGARIAASGHGGQILLSQTTSALVEDSLPENVRLENLGSHRLKDLEESESIWQLCLAGLPANFPPLKTITNRPRSIPAQTTLLIGRSVEIEEGVATLLRDEVRLLTLTGPGGTGKTRLGIAIAERSVDEFEDGVFFVPLAPLTDATQVLPAINRILDIGETDASPLQAIVARVGDKRLLLMLDNFEQIADAAGELSPLLAECPRLKILVTSRIPLHLGGEWEFPVLPLALPRNKTPLSSEDLSAFAAVQLFVDRARAVRPGFALTDENAAAVGEICTSLDGLPLAIELAAARAKLLSPQAMLSRMGNRLALLTGGARDLPARQQTLRGAIAWSYGMLDDAEKVLFARLGVFAAGCTIDAVNQICNEGEDSLDGICSLADKSLLRQSEDAGGEPRFWMLETIREFALEMLGERGEEEAVRLRHARYFARQIASNFVECGHRDQFEFSASVKKAIVEMDNLRAALAYLLQHEPPLALEMADGMFHAWHIIRGPEAIHWMRSAAEGAGDADPGLLGRVYLNLGNMAHHVNEYDSSRQYLERSLELFRVAGDKQAMGRVLGSLAEFYGKTGEFGREQIMLEEAINLARSCGDDAGLSGALFNQATAWMREGNFAAAKPLFSIAVEMTTRQGNDWAAAFALMDLGLVHYLCGDLGQARSHVEKARRLIATSFFSEHDYESEKSLWILGRITAAEGDRKNAWELISRALKYLNASGASNESWLHAQCLEALGCLCVENGHFERAARLWGAAAAMRENLKLRLFPMDRTDYDPAMQKLRAVLNERTFEAAWQSGYEAPKGAVVELVAEPTLR